MEPGRLDAGRRNIVGPRVVLRPHQATDAPGLVAQCADPLAVRWTTVRQPYSLDDAQDFLRHIEDCWNSPDPAAAFWAIDASITAGPRYCGTIELRPLGGAVVEVAYGSHPQARGQGYMTEAVALVCRYAFDELGVQYVHWRAAVGNQASLAVAQRAGFRLEGTIRGLLDFPDGPRDGWYATLSANELDTLPASVTPDKS